MPEKKESNNRVKIGLGIFAVLVLANIFVHGSRMSRAPAKTEGKSAVAAVPAANPVGNEGRVEKAAGVASSSVSAMATPETFIKERTEPLVKVLEEMKKRVEKIARPLMPPDSGLSLIVNDREFFRTARPTGQTEARPAALKPVDRAVKPLKILGEFVVNGRKRLLVQGDAGVYVVGEDLPEGAEGVALLSGQGTSYLLRDGGGEKTTVDAAGVVPDRIEEAVKVLRGQGSGGALKIIESKKDGSGKSGR